jgi:solute carrier family 35 protein C2
VQQWYRKRRAEVVAREAASARAPVSRWGTRARTAGLIAAWYFLSSALSLFNKHLLGRRRGRFPAPLLMTATQFCWQYGFAAALLRGPMAHLRPPPVPTRVWRRGVVPVGVCTAGDVALSNLSLIYISLSFYVMCKSSVPLFLLIFAFALGLEAPSWRLGLAVAVIVAGVACAVAGEADFDGRGFALVMGAAALSGLRWTLTQLLMRAGAGAATEPTGLGHPLVLLYRVLPVMAAAAACASLLLERAWETLPASAYMDSPAHALETLLLLLLAAGLAFGMSMAEFALVHHTSAVTLVVAGTCKEGVLVAAATAVDGDAFGALNAIGLLLLVAGVGIYNWARAAAAAERKALAAAASGGGGGAGGVQLEAVAAAPGGAHGAGGAAGAGGAGSPRRVKGGYARLLDDAEEGRGGGPGGGGAGAAADVAAALLPPSAAAATTHQRAAHRASVTGGAGSAVSPRDSVDAGRGAGADESYSDILESLLQNKTR